MGDFNLRTIENKRFEELLNLFNQKILISHVFSPEILCALIYYEQTKKTCLVIPIRGT